MKWYVWAFVVGAIFASGFFTHKFTSDKPAPVIAPSDTVVVTKMLYRDRVDTLYKKFYTVKKEVDTVIVKEPVFIEHKQDYLRSWFHVKNKEFDASVLTYADCATDSVQLMYQMNAEYITSVFKSGYIVAEEEQIHWWKPLALGFVVGAVTWEVVR